MVEFNYAGLSNDDRIVVESLMKTEPDLIIDNLYLGNLSHSKMKDVLKRLGVSVILQISSEEYPLEFPDDFEYHPFEFGDFSEVYLEKHIVRGIKILKEAHSQGRTCFIHCAAGVSRSASIVIAYLMHIKGWDFA